MKTRFWLWKNFISGDPVYVAFDNAFPCHMEGGDPLVVGNPCGLAYFEESSNGRPEVDDLQVMAEVRRSLYKGLSIRPEWIDKLAKQYGARQHAALRGDRKTFEAADNWMRLTADEHWHEIIAALRRPPLSEEQPHGTTVKP